MQFLLVAAMPAVGALIAAPALADEAVRVGEVVEPPFLHTLTKPLPGICAPLDAGDMALIIPGFFYFGGNYLLRDGRFAAVTTILPRNEVAFNVYGENDTFSVPMNRAASLVSGRVARRLACVKGRWMEAGAAI